MDELSKIQVARGVYWVEAQPSGLRILCGCPADSIKHLIKRGLIGNRQADGRSFESGPNAILLSDVLIQNGAFANLAEFPVLQMLYRQGMILPNHPNNTGRKPLLIGSKSQIEAQLQYIYRGNYGLISDAELMAAGASPTQANELMRMKRRFAFGRILRTEELLDTLVVGNDPVELNGELTIQRLRVNVFEFQTRSHSVTVDLNLSPGIRYESPYTLGFQDIRREYFGVIHSGDGDGWDPSRPAMSSILMYQGKLYLIDAGPNVLHSLDALGIGTNEIEGIFHTHLHDDHFCGLAALMRSDRRIKYYATALVRAGVAKKLAALTAKPEEEFLYYFEAHDLEPEVWTNLDGLEVIPRYSPHPVETFIMAFRVRSGYGYRTYAHLADIASLKVLRGMITRDGSGPGLSRTRYEAVAEGYLEPADIKKIDVGGEPIHGNAEDFRGDRSPRIILAHTSKELTPKQKEIGSSTPFGTVDVLISGQQDYLRRGAFNFLVSHFPSVPYAQLGLLLDGPFVTFDPGFTLLKPGVLSDFIYLLVTGKVEKIDARAGILGTLTAGTLLGEIAVLTATPATQTYRAKSFVHALKLPASLYLDFIKQHGLYDEIVRLQERRQFLKKTWLFGEALSYPVENRLARAMKPALLPPSQDFMASGEHELFMVRDGKVQLCIDDDVLEVLSAGDFWGEGEALFHTPDLYRTHAADEAAIFRIPSEFLLDIPIVRWKLFETYERRVEMMFNPALISSTIFRWREEYRINIKEMDTHHERLFRAAKTLDQAMAIGEEGVTLEDIWQFLLDHAATHCAAEEELLRTHGYPELEHHRRQHQKFLEDVLAMKQRADAGVMPASTDVMSFFKDWIINHILTEDRKYGPFLNERGVN